MERRSLGSAGPEISVVGFGAWEAGGEEWGPEVPDRDVAAAIEAGLDAGMNWIDTAEVYGHGRSEELVGRVVRRRRDEVLVFTKVAPFMSGARPEQVTAAIRASLLRLGLDHVDLYQIHWPAEHEVPVEETWGAMAQAQDDGLARWIGVSNFQRDLIERCLSIRHVDAVQNRFNLLHQRDRMQLLPWLAEKGVGYLGYAPLAFGLLTGTITAETRFDPLDWRSGEQNVGYYDDWFAPGAIEGRLARVERLRAIATRLGVSVASLAIRGALETPGLTAVIAGSRNPAHTAENAAAADLTLDRPTLEEISAAVAD